VALAARLSEERKEVYVHDPLALQGAMAVLQDKVVPLMSAEECVKAVDVLVITTPWPQFKDIPHAAFARSGPRLQVLDCWRILPREQLRAVADIHYLGIKGSDS
jgi:UDP-glucose 6-dehydrogenase